MDDLLQQRIEFSQKIASDPRFGVGSGYISGLRDIGHLHTSDVTVTWIHISEINDQGELVVHAYLYEMLPKLGRSGIYARQFDFYQEIQRSIRDDINYRPALETLILSRLGDSPFQFGDLVQPPAVMQAASSSDGKATLGELGVTLIPFSPDLLRTTIPDVVDNIPNEFAEDVPASDKFAALFLEQRGLLLFSRDLELTQQKLTQITEAAEQYLQSRNVTTFDFGSKSQAPHVQIAMLRQRLSECAQQPLIVTSAALPDGIPLDGLPEAVFVTAADTQFTHRTVAGDITAAIPDDARVIFDFQRGLFTVGETVDGAFRAMDIAQRGAQIIAAANQLGVYNAPDVRGGSETSPKPEVTRRQFDGEVALITGAASGIGKATTEVFLERGAAVIGLDINPAITEMFGSQQFLGIHGDVRNVDDVKRAVSEGVQTFGGIDIVFLNAGINEDHAPLEDANMELWDWVMSTNVDGNVIILKEVYDVLKHAPKSGRIIMNASKSAPAPGPGSSSYTVSKAAITQLGRLTALEWGKDNIRVYVVHPNAVFDTLIWKDNMAEKRASHYGLTLQQYKTNNLLKVEIKSRDVGEIVADLCGDHFRKVTGIQLPIDGGNNRVI